MSDIFPAPKSLDAAQSLVSTNVTITRTDLEPIITGQKLEEKKLITAEKSFGLSKRQRTCGKQRHSDLYTQFSNLTKLLKKIEAEYVKSDEIRKDFVAELSPASLSNASREYLIGKTTFFLNCTHIKNQKKNHNFNEINEEFKVTKRRVE